MKITLASLYVPGKMATDPKGLCLSVLRKISVILEISKKIIQESCFSLEEAPSPSLLKSIFWFSEITRLVV